MLTLECGAYRHWLLRFFSDELHGKITNYMNNGQVLMKQIMDLSSIKIPPVFSTTTTFEFCFLLSTRSGQGGAGTPIVILILHYNAPFYCYMNYATTLLNDQDF